MKKPPKTGYRSVSIGSIFEVKVGHNVAYFQVIDKYMKGWTVRVMRGIFEKRVDDIRLLESLPDHFITVLHNLITEQRLCRIYWIGSCPVPERFSKGVKCYKTNVMRDLDGRRKSDEWWLKNDREAIRVGRLTEDQKRAPDSDGLSISSLIRYIKFDYDPLWEFKPAGSPKFRIVMSDLPPVHGMGLYSAPFLSLKAAEAAKKMYTHIGMAEVIRIVEVQTECGTQFFVEAEVENRKLRKMMS